MENLNFKKYFVTYEKKISEIDSVVFELKNLKSIIVSTDTVSGLLSLQKQKIYEIKKRDKSKKIITFISNVNQIPNASKELVEIANNFWPGALTIIFNKNSYRIPKDEFILELIKAIGPIYSSSANLSGQKPVEDILDAFKYFKKVKNDIIFIEGDYYINKFPSTILDLDNKKILREGVIKYEQLRKYIE